MRRRWWRDAARPPRSRRETGTWLGIALALAIAACGRAVAPPTPGRPQSGIASWYGPGFHGRATSSGETYDQHDLTAAHPTLPLGTVARVTNLDNGRSVAVRINDRGPFVKGRAIDLSEGAARVIGMIGPGTAAVRIEVLEHPDGHSGIVYCVQVAAFSEEARARALRSDLAPRYGDVYISAVPAHPDPLYRVRLGPFVERGDAERRATELAALGLSAFVAEEPYR